MSLLHAGIRDGEADRVTIADLRTRYDALQAKVSEARAMAFNLYRDGVLRDTLGENGEPLSDIHNLLAAALNTGLEGDGE